MILGKITQGKIYFYNRWQPYASIPYATVMFREQTADPSIFIVGVEICPWKVYTD